MPGEAIHKYGIGRGVGTSFEALSNLGSFNWLQAASSVRIKAGGNAADDAAGAGAQSVKIYGLDENWNAAEETVATAGALASSGTTTTFIRVFRACVINCGTYGGNNTGNIVIETTGGTDLLQLDAGEGQTQYGAFSVAANRTARVKLATVFADSSKSTAVRMFVRQNADDATTPFSPAQLKWLAPGVASWAQQTSFESFDIPAKSDIWFEGKVSSTTADISVNFEMELVRV